MAERFTETENPMAPICRAWIEKIDCARKVRDEKFGVYAREAEQFYNGPQDWMWLDEVARGKGGFLDKDSNAALPMFRMNVNKPAETVALFGPALFFKYPDVVVQSVSPPLIPPESLGIDPTDKFGMQYYQQYAMQEENASASRELHATLKQHYANWVQVEGDKKTQARRAITEALTAGLGLLETKWHNPPGSRIHYPKSFYKSWKHYYKDPDAEYHEDVQWIVLETTATVQHWERKFRLKPGRLKGHIQSYDAQATQRGRREAKSNQLGGKSFDLVTVYEVYSKHGFGDRLKGTDGKAVRTKLDFSPLGDFCYLALVRGIPYPLNLPTEALHGDAEEVFNAVQWPIPYAGDASWPVSELGFLDDNRSVWPIPLIKPVIGPMRFVNWCMSFLADKTAASCTTYIGRLKKAGVEIQRQVQGGLSPYGVIDIANDMGKSIGDLVTFLDAPDFQEHIWRMVVEANEMIDKGTGLTELVYGLSTTQIRSAEEVKVKSGNISIRPDEMASRTEDWLSESVSKEIQALVYLAGEEDVRPVLGEMGARIFVEQIATRDLDEIMRDFSFRVAAGSARKPNKAARASALNEFAQYAMPPFVQLAGAGMLGPLNALLQDIADANDLDGDRYVIEAPEQQGPSPEEQEMMLKQQEFEMKLAEMQAKLGMEQESNEQEFRHEEEMHDMELTNEREKGRLEIGLAKQKAKSDQSIMEQKTQSQIRVNKAQAQSKIQVAKQQAKAKPKSGGKH